jgi:uncharacterized protein YqeY/predicted RNA-binding protein YlqC (UPF0109 family)
MSLKETITNDMKSAMKAGDSQKLGTIRMLLAAVKQREVDERITLTDADVVALVEKAIKQRKEAIAQFSAGGRNDLVEKETAEITVLTPYLPAQMSDTEVDADPGNLVPAPTATAVLTHVVRSIVDDPDAVRVESSESRGKIRLEVRVGEGDLGRVIGRRGRTAQSIRTIVRAAATRDDVEVDIEFED